MEPFWLSTSAITQVPGVGVIEDAPVKFVHGVRARWPDSTSYIARVYTSFQGILIYMIIIADSLLGSNQVRHVDAAVGKPASDHECERDHKCGNVSESRGGSGSDIATTPINHMTAETAAANSTVTAQLQLNRQVH